jgi:hypothetical protein
MLSHHCIYTWVNTEWDFAYFESTHCKKRLATVPPRESLVSDIPSRESLVSDIPPRESLVSHILPWESLVSEIPAGDGNVANLFLRCAYNSTSDLTILSQRRVK